MLDRRFPYLRRPEGREKRVADEVCRRKSCRAAFNDLHGSIMFYVVPGWDIAVWSISVRNPDGSFRQPAPHEIDDACFRIWLAQLPRKAKDEMIAKGERQRKQDADEAYRKDCADKRPDRIDALERRRGRRRSYLVSGTKGG